MLPGRIALVRSTTLPLKKLLLEVAAISEKFAAFVAAAALMFWSSVTVNSNPSATRVEEELVTTAPVRSMVIVSEAVVTLPAASMASTGSCRCPTPARQQLQIDGNRHAAAGQQDLRLAVGESA